MLDLKPGDKFVSNNGKTAIIHVNEDGSGTWEEPLVFKNLTDYAAWWTRQAELNADISIPLDLKQTFSKILELPESERT